MATTMIWGASGGIGRVLAAYQEGHKGVLDL